MTEYILTYALSKKWRTRETERKDNYVSHFSVPISHLLSRNTPLWQRGDRGDFFDDILVTKSLLPSLFQREEYPVFLSPCEPMV